MACLEHDCLDCQHAWFDNNPSRTCPVCGSTHTVTRFDEDCDDVDTPEYEEQDDDENCL